MAYKATLLFKLHQELYEHVTLYSRVSPIAYLTRAPC